MKSRFHIVHSLLPENRRPSSLVLSWKKFRRILSILRILKIEATVLIEHFFLKKVPTENRFHGNYSIFPVEIRNFLDPPRQPFYKNNLPILLAKTFLDFFQLEFQ